jgi:DNA-binding NarL/FixJ family response regulator
MTTTPSTPSPTRARLDRRKILIVDDHELFSTSLAMALRRYGLDAGRVDFRTVEDVLSAARAAAPGLVVLDLHLGTDTQGRPIDGTDLVRTLRTTGWAVLVVSGSADHPSIAAAIAAGAIGSVSKSASFQSLLDAVGNAVAGRSVMSQAEHRQWLELHRNHQAGQRELAKRLDRLSAREREVLELLVAGERAAAIAQRFTVSMTTVRTQIRSILTKLGATSQLEAVALVRRHPPFFS